MPDTQPSSDLATPAALLARCTGGAPTPLLNLPRLAAALGVAEVFAKDEGRRMLGSFKALGGIYAGLRTLSRASGLAVEALLDPARRAGKRLPALVCASDGNHGLAVATGARLAGATARVFLPAIVPQARIARILAAGAEAISVPGTYEDAVRAAAEAARDGDALLVADTSEQPDDPVVGDVMAGYGVMAEEIRAQLGTAAPTHLFVQAGVGGLAAAMAEGLHHVLAPPGRVVVAEPASAACVAAALQAGRPLLVPGALETSAEMLSCGEASAPALATLLRHDAAALAVPEAALLDAPAFLAAHGGPTTTPSGAAGLAALRQALQDAALAGRLGLGPDSRVLVLVTEATPA